MNEIDDIFQKNRNETRHPGGIILPEPTLRRLPWYLAFVEILYAQGTDHVSSTHISRALNVDASQIAKDLSFLSIKGKTRIGYDVGELRDILADFLGFRVSHKALVIGAGSLGRALMCDTGLSSYGLDIVAALDVNPSLVGTFVDGRPIYHIDDIESVAADTEASIAILTVPSDAAQEAADIAISAGIRAIWNFTPYRVKTAEGIVMANTSIYAHLAMIYNRLENLNRQ